jgi:hypothetical protein
MRIDPVFLVAPPPPVPSMPTRRAFVIASSTFLAGAAVGGACGYSAGAANAATANAANGQAVDASAEQELPKSGDHELDQLRWLAVKAPLDELFAKAPVFLSTRVSTYKNDEILWKGVERMTREIVDNPSRRVDPAVIGFIITQINGTAHPSKPSLGERVPRLRERLSEERARK